MLTYPGYRGGHFSSPQHSPLGRSHQTGYTPYLPNSSLHRSAYSHLHKFLVYTLQHTWLYIHVQSSDTSMPSVVFYTHRFIHLPIQLTKIKYRVEMKSCAFTLVTLRPLPSNDTAQQTCTIGLRTVSVLRMKLWFTLRATGLTTSRSIFVRWTSWKRSNSIKWFIRHLDTVDFLFYRVLNSDGCFVSYHMNIIKL